MLNFNEMKRFVLFILMCVICLSKLIAANFTNESLNYYIYYHWGFVWKHAATATLSIKDCGTQFDARLCARTLSWVDKIYTVRDTLYSTIEKDGFYPIKYVKATHEKGYHAHDVVDFSFDGNKTMGLASRVRPGKKVAQINLETQGNAYDMLSVFYVLRQLDLEKLRREGAFSTTVFCGKYKETLNIKYVKVDKITLRDDSEHFAHQVKFSFTQEGNSKSSDDIDAWLSVDDAHIPLLLKGSLPIGEVCVYYTK